jgi:hypothetical protein
MTPPNSGHFDYTGVEGRSRLNIERSSAVFRPQWLDNIDVVLHGIVGACTL